MLKVLSLYTKYPATDNLGLDLVIVNELEQIKEIKMLELPSNSDHNEIRLLMIITKDISAIMTESIDLRKANLERLRDKIGSSIDNNSGETIRTVLNKVGNLILH